MRVSTYEMFFHFPEYGKTIMFNGLSGTLDTVPISMGTALEQEAINKSKCVTINESVSQVLLKRYHLTELTEEDEISSCFELANKYEKIQKPVYDAHRFIILPTYKCNFCCPYCYERDIEDRVSTNKPEQLMTKEQVDNIFSIMERYPYIAEKSQMEIFGGEPLYKNTLPIVRYIVEKATRAGRNITVTTNGYDLNLFEDLLSPAKISAVQITVDGTEAIHNARRVSRSGGKTFHKIIDNMRLALDKGIVVRARVNVDKSNLTSYVELINYFKEIGYFEYPKFVFTYALVRTLPGQKNDLCITDSEFFDYLEKNITDNTLMSYAISEENGGLLRNLLNNPVAASKTRYCGAVGSSIFFSPDNLLYNCTEVVGQPQYAIGTYDTEIHIDEKKESVWKKRHMPNIPECLRCPLVFMCSGGCAFRAMECGCADGPYCVSIKESFERRLRIEAKLYDIFTRS